MHLAPTEQPLFMGNRWKTYQGGENDAGQGGGGGGEDGEGHIADGACDSDGGGGDSDVTCGIRCHCRLAGYTKKTVFCFSSARR